MSRNSDLVVEFNDQRQKLIEYARRFTGDYDRAEDVVQEAFLKFQTASDRLAVEEPIAYFYRIVRNLALDRYRRVVLEKKNFVPGYDDMSDRISSDMPSPEDSAIGRERLNRLAAALADLPERTRIAIEMHRFGGCTLKDIAAHLDISVSMVHHLIAQGLAHCMDSLDPPE